MRLDPALQLTSTPIAPTLGATISGIDLSAPADDDVRRLRSLLDEHLVLFFRNQRLSAIQQRNLAARLGDLYTHPFFPQERDAPGIIVFEHGEARKAAQNAWHTDVTYVATPPSMSLLYGEVTPALGGDTLWANMYAAFDALSLSMQSILKEMRAVHDFAKDFPPARFVTYGINVDHDEIYASNPPVSHPVVRRHAATGRYALYVNSSFTTHIEGLYPRESDALLRFLFEHVAQPEFQVRWHWEPGDVALWHNHWTQHYAVSDYFPERRRMRRATIMEQT